MIIAELMQYPVAGETAPFASWNLLFRVEQEDANATAFYSLDGDRIEMPAFAHQAIPETLGAGEMKLARIGLRRISRDLGDRIAWLKLNGSGGEQTVRQVWSTTQELDS